VSDLDRAAFGEKRLSRPTATVPAIADSIRDTKDPELSRIEFAPPVPLSQLGPGDAVSWRWYGYLAADHVSLLTGLWKAGKTTLLAYLLRVFGAGGDLAGSVEPARVLIVSEESRGLWSRRRDEIGIGDHVHVMVRPFMGRPTMDAWLAFVEYVAGLCGPDGYTVVVLDTLSSLWPVSDENDAARVLAALSPLHRITAAGAALLLVHHPRKGDAGEFQSARGSGALSGFVDAIIELRRLNPADHDDRRRVLTAISRFDETPGEAVIELADDGYRTVGSKADAKRSDRLVVIDELLPTDPPGLTPEEVKAGWPEGGIPAPSIRTLRRDLADGVSSQGWRAAGTGHKGDPVRYWRSDSIRDSSTPKGSDLAGIESPGDAGGNGDGNGVPAGWTPTGWRDRRLQLAERCGGVNPEQAADLRRQAAALGGAGGT